MQRYCICICIHIAIYSMRTLIVNSSQRGRNFECLVYRTGGINRGINSNDESSHAVLHRVYYVRYKLSPRCIPSRASGRCIPYIDVDGHIGEYAPAIYVTNFTALRRVFLFLLQNWLITHRPFHSPGEIIIYASIRRRNKVHDYGFSSREFMVFLAALLLHAHTLSTLCNTYTEWDFGCAVTRASLKCASSSFLLGKLCRFFESSTSRGDSWSFMLRKVHCR